jgi:tyrosyl-tRNA synthetase
MELKKRMAYDIVAKFWSADEAARARQAFEALFQKKDYSQAQEFQMPVSIKNPLWIVDLLKTLGAITSSSEAKRLIESGAITIDGVPITDFKAQIAWESGMVIKAGKHKIYQLK